MTELEQAVAELRQGNAIVFPTETVYGLGANAWDATAVAKIFEIKNRPRVNPLIVHIHSFTQLLEVAANVPEAALSVAKHFWPGPLTLVLPKNNRIPDNVSAGLPTIGIRMPAHPVARQLIEMAGFPLAAPSANLSGSLSPTRVEHAREQLGDRVSIILDGGPCSVGVESTILKFEGDTPILLRPGGIPVEKIEEVIGRSIQFLSRSERPLAPGMLAHHYAPKTRLVFIEEGDTLPSLFGKVGLLCLKKNGDSRLYASIEELSPSGDLRVAAANLFSALHRLDRLELDIVVARAVPSQGLGLAINDRLRRASCVVASEAPVVASEAPVVASEAKQSPPKFSSS